MIKMIAFKHASVIFFISLICVFGCGKKTSGIDSAVYQKEIKDWQEKRAERLRSDNGWFTLCGLFWLNEGENKFGTDSSNAIIFPQGKTIPFAGALLLKDGVVKLQTQPKAEIRINDSIVTSSILQTDEEGKAQPTILTTGTLSFYVIKRGSQLGVRVKDKENSARINFKGLDYFPVDLKWRIKSKFEPYVPPKVIQIATVINTVESDTCIGALVFEIDGVKYKLDAVLERGTPDQLFLMFSDETSGKETYGTGRQLNTDMPDTDNKVVIDFNKAYNWPCAYTEYATCPIPPRDNHLNLRVEAGEKKYPGSKH
jgi:uncharacterized protein